MNKLKFFSVPIIVSVINVVSFVVLLCTYFSSSWWQILVSIASLLPMLIVDYVYIRLFQSKAFQDIIVQLLKEKEIQMEEKAKSERTFIEDQILKGFGIDNMRGL